MFRAVSFFLRRTTPRSTSLPLRHPTHKKSPSPSPYRSLGYLVSAALAVPAFVSLAAEDSPSVSSSLSFWPSSTKTDPSELPIAGYRRTPSRFPTDMPPAPGRPETLTKDEEARLKELWGATLKVFGVGIEVNGDAAADVESVKEEASSTAPTEEKKKKKPLGRFLSRKEKKDDKGSSTSANSSDVNLPDEPAGDKYGQTKDFKVALATQSPAELRDAFWSMVKCDDPDGLLLRFLRARKWDVEKALVMMVSTMNWRAKEMNVQAVIEKGEGGAVEEKDEDFMKQLRMGKSVLHGLDKEGRPVCYVRVRLHKQGDQSEDSLQRYTVYIMETARLMLHAPVDTAAVVFDMTDFSLANMDYAPVKFMIKCFEAHYPESLGICLVHKAPWVFQGVWNIIKGWLDPVVASKIHFTKTVEDMEAYIPRDHIPKDLGGDEDWEYKYTEPVPGENDAMKDKARFEQLQSNRAEVVKQYEELTKAWIQGDEQASAQAKQSRKELTNRLEGGYWDMDKYLRARTLYDRIGVLKPSGELDFYGKRTEPAAPAAQTSEDDID